MMKMFLRTSALKQVRLFSTTSSLKDSFQFPSHQALFNDEYYDDEYAAGSEDDIFDQDAEGFLGQNNILTTYKRRVNESIEEVARRDERKAFTRGLDKADEFFSTLN